MNGDGLGSRRVFCVVKAIGKVTDIARDVYRHRKSHNYIKTRQHQHLDDDLRNKRQKDMMQTYATALCTYKGCSYRRMISQKEEDKSILPVSGVRPPSESANRGNPRGNYTRPACIIVDNRPVSQGDTAAFQLTTEIILV